MIEISVVIPTYNSKKDLETCLKALANQTFPKDGYEAIVVDDGSTDGTKLAVEEMTGELKYQIKYFAQENSGPAVARNLGIKEAEGEIVAFTDADCLAKPDWLEAIEESFKNFEIIGVSGRTVSPEVIVFPWKLAPVGLGYKTCNIAYKKAVLEEAGGFDEKFEAPYYEDNDLALRIEKGGGVILQNPRVVVTHPAKELSLEGMAKQAFLHKFDSLLFRLHPGYVNAFGAPFRPLLWRLSPVGLGFVLCLVLLFGGSLLLGLKVLFLTFGLFLTLFAFFLLRGYRLCISWLENPKGETSLSLGDRVKTFATLLFYIPLFLLARAIGLVKYRKFLF